MALLMGQCQGPEELWALCHKPTVFKALYGKQRLGVTWSCLKCRFLVPIPDLQNPDFGWDARIHALNKHSVAPVYIDFDSPS